MGRDRFSKFNGNMSLPWGKLRQHLELANAGHSDTLGLRHFNWDPTCSLVYDFGESKDLFVCVIFTEQVEDAMKFVSVIKGGI